MSGRNVVPMPMPHGQPQGQMMPQMWSGGGMPAGCCPPGGDMSALLQCYCDIQAATAFISKVVTDLAANDPAFQQALVDGIVASGSNIPLIGVTNGSDAQPGQVGEWFGTNTVFNITGASQTQSVTAGVMQPGDWDIWASINFSVAIVDVAISLSPVPTGVNGNMATVVYGGGSAQSITLQAAATRASFSVPTLIVFEVITNNTGTGGGSGTGIFAFAARRRR